MWWYWNRRNLLNREEELYSLENFLNEYLNDGLSEEKKNESVLLKEKISKLKQGLGRKILNVKGKRMKKTKL